MARGEGGYRLPGHVRLSQAAARGAGDEDARQTTGAAARCATAVALATRRQWPWPGGAPLAPLAPLTPRAAPPAGEKYAFVTLPYAEFVEGTINQDNIGFGALCPLPAGGLPADALVHGLVIFSKRSAAISAWLTGIDLVFVKASLETREVLLEVGLDTQHAQH
eukprot:scaffold82452_cov48-Phaeocystis_antarctica.AAC.1